MLNTKLQLAKFNIIIFKYFTSLAVARLFFYKKVVKKCILVKICRKTTASTPIKPLNFDLSKFESCFKTIFLTIVLD
jgi:hypothetical protein